MLQGASGDGRVVEDAVAGPLVGVGMVGAAGEVDRHAVGDRRPRRGERRARGASGAPHQLRRPGQADLSRLGLGQPARQDAIDVSSVVDPKQIGDGGRFRGKLHAVGG